MKLNVQLGKKREDVYNNFHAQNLILLKVFGVGYAWVDFRM